MAIRWTGRDASRLLVAVHVPDHSNCREMGTFRAFELALPSGRVVAEHDQATARRTLRDDLGDALRGGGER